MTEEFFQGGFMVLFGMLIVIIITMIAESLIDRRKR